MKKFQFRLATVLRLREAQLAIEEGKLRQLLAENRKIENSLRLISEERVDSENWLLKDSNLTSSDLRSLSAFLLGSKAREASLQQARESCAQDIAAQTQRTLAAERNQSLLQQLRSKQYDIWQKSFDSELEIISQEAWQAAQMKRVSDEAAGGETP